MGHHVALEVCTTEGCKYQGQQRHLSLKYHSPRSLGRGVYAIEMFMCDCGAILEVLNGGHGEQSTPVDSPEPPAPSGPAT